MSATIADPGRIVENDRTKAAHASLTAEQRAKTAERCRKKYDQLIEPLRTVARLYGYALAVHGSIARDIDLVAIPWTAEARPASELATALYTECCAREPIPARWGWDGTHDRWFTMAGCPGKKVHGRLCWVILLCETYIDLSVMPTTGRCA